ncbi:hypothetical protein B0G84_3287 [Paraburkholderia sp. BL8N3]|nr:hypothetical protein [Paraburkholderia sp. BL8N3]TCK37986.1 hypothetical protein B0G84_3287 [Paraburkholderia sp. BL8N3]
MKFGQWLSDLLGYPWIERLEAMTLKPNDVLVIHVAPGWKRDELDRIAKDIAPHLPEHVQVLLMVGDTRVEVLRPPEPDAAALLRAKEHHDAA